MYEGPDHKRSFCRPKITHRQCGFSILFYFILFYFLFPASSPPKNHILRCITFKKISPGPAQVMVAPGEKVWWGATNHEMMDGLAQRACGQRCWWVEGKSKLHRPPQLLKKHLSHETARYAMGNYWKKGSVGRGGGQGPPWVRGLGQGGIVRSHHALRWVHHDLKCSWWR